jgi:hypothetical protein
LKAFAPSGAQGVGDAGGDLTFALNLVDGVVQSKVKRSPDGTTTKDASLSFYPALAKKAKSTRN